MIHAIKKIKKKEAPPTPKAHLAGNRISLWIFFHISNIPRRDAGFQRIAHSLSTTCSQNPRSGKMFLA
jgi:hypothetical protein